MTTRDANLPAEYSAGLDRLSLAPLWTALHVLLPQERVTEAVPHRWRWPDHGHEGSEPVIWLDGLDIPLVRSFEAAWASKMRPAVVPATAIDSSQDEFTAAGVVPRASRYEDTGYPQVRWPWTTVRRALEAMAAAAQADQPVVLRYVNPGTGTFPLRTIGSEAQWLRPGEATRAERRTASGVFHVIEGQGESRIGDEVFTWERGDCVVAPPWHWIQHKNQIGRAHV